MAVATHESSEKVSIMSGFSERRAAGSRWEPAEKLFIPQDWGFGS